MTFPKHLSSTSLMTIALALPASLAQAESASRWPEDQAIAPCPTEAIYVEPAQSATIPRNSPALRLEGRLSAPEMDPILLDATGSRVPFTSESTGNRHLVRPTVGLVASGKYSLSFFDAAPSCVTRQRRTSSFTAGPEVDLPARFDNAALKVDRALLSTNGAKQVSFKVVLQPSQVTPFLGTTRFNMRVSAPALPGGTLEFKGVFPQGREVSIVKDFDCPKGAELTIKAEVTADIAGLHRLNGPGLVTSLQQTVRCDEIVAQSKGDGGAVDPNFGPDAGVPTVGTLDFGFALDMPQPFFPDAGKDSQVDAVATDPKIDSPTPKADALKPPEAPKPIEAPKPTEIAKPADSSGCSMAAGSAHGPAASFGALVTGLAFAVLRRRRKSA